MPDTDQPNTNSAPIATISTLAAHEGERVTLRGWLYNIRSSGKLLFPTFRDGTATSARCPYQRAGEASISDLSCR